MSPILVTGLSGFVGSYLAQRPDVRGLHVGDQLVDLTSAGEVEHAVAAIRPAAVIHLAAQSSVTRSHQDAAATYGVNFNGTLNLLSALRACGFRGRMLYVGSGDVYGSVAPSDLPVTESAPLRPRNPYAVSKAAAEALCYQWSQTGPFEVVIARPFNHIGPRQGTAFAVADFARQIVSHRRGCGDGMLRVGDIDATRDFTDVRDIVAAYGDLLAKGRNGEAYNVCSDTECSLREIVAVLFEVTGIDIPIEVAPERLRPSEQRRMRGSYRKLRQETGWEPRIPLRQTLADIVNYWGGMDPS